MALQLKAERLQDETERLGRFLVAHLFILFKTSLNYAEGHAALETPVSNVLKVLDKIRETNIELTLSVRRETLYLGGLRLRSEAAAYEAYRFVTQEMTKHDIGALTFGFCVTAEELKKLPYVLWNTDAEARHDRYRKILEQMQRRGILNIYVEALAEEAEYVAADGKRLKDARTKAYLLYSRAVTVIEEVMLCARAGQPLRLREAKRVVQGMIEMVAGGGTSLLGLTTLHRHDANSHNHAVNVCILSLALGARAGISKLHLCELGMAALFHNIGKAAFPAELVNKPGEPSRHERQALEGHPVYGVMKMMKLKELDQMSSRIISGIFEHHLLADFSGYPRFPYGKLGLHGRIISIADRYDVLTSAWIGRRPPLPPDRALRQMLRQAGTLYDPALLKLLLVTLGMHGIGSLLLLRSGELAVIVESDPDPDHWDRPRVKIIADADGKEIDGDIVPLSDSNPSRAISTILDPNPFKIDVSHYFR